MDKTPARIYRASGSEMCEGIRVVHSRGLRQDGANPATVLTALVHLACALITLKKGSGCVLPEIPFPRLELLLVDLATGIALA